ncbi:hypothetical protein HIM_06621 [Hirsutella minnesotensis 3608]|uniref:Zn(2)-C6 fungal-type domain-containing protein n=1 Tax=Hirsutella minnesotensis 3608 TaxID=1043627 RepID=A0A0F7ZTZ1_9HYPO|nr:hypothetical protein HIM_06621 [Hirsutella minnesotensis 3608]
MSSPVTEPGPIHGGSTRPYRSQKRQRPCDRCRERKLRCQSEGGQPPCQRCQQSNVTCSFLSRPRKRVSAQPQRTLSWQPRSSSMCQGQHRSSSSSSPLAGHPQQHHRQSHQASIISSSADEGVPAPESRDGEPSKVHVSTHIPNSGTLAHALGTPALTGLHPHGPSTQLSQSLDQIQGHAAVLLGGSSESDPWLLRHCRFDELGLRTFHKVHFRHAGGVPTSDRIPVHFLLSADELCESAAAETRVAGAKELRAELDMLVPPAYGARLIRLFHRHVFPILPVVSRTQLGLTHGDAVPDGATLESLPVHLLAALYGSALPFVVNDDQLAVLHMYDQLPLDRVWRVVYRSLHDQLHRPRLSVLQAALLYLHKTASDRGRYAASDTAFVWSFMGTVVGLAHSLGLHLECRMFGVPAWEKRQRRRLWWAVYIEDKWLALLMGRPPYIRQDEWDVSALDDADFDIHHPSTYASAVPAKSAFRDMARLALVADSVQASL